MFRVWTISVVLLAVCHFALAASTIFAAVLFVAVDGDDAAQGTVDHPLASIAKAQLLVRQRLTSGADEDITVTLRGGTYYLPEPIVFTSADSAPQGRHVTYAAAEGETVILSGGRPIANWKQVDDRWQAELPEVRAGEWFFRELFASDARLPRARTPNTGYLRIERAGADDRTSFRFAAADAKHWHGIAGGELVFLHDWSTSRVNIAAIDQKSRTVQLAQPVGASAPHYRMSHFEPQPRYFVENLPSLIDAPGEWYLDRASGVLTYFPREGETPDSTKLIAPRLQSLVVVQGDDERAVRGLRLQGLTFMHCAWNLPEGGYAAGQACFHEQRDDGVKNPLRAIIPAAITLDQADDCEITQCRLARLGGCGIHIRRTCRNNLIRDCKVQNVAGNGIMIGETITRRATGGAKESLVSQGNAVIGNTVEHCGAEFYGAVGIWIGIAAETKVADNEIRHLPYTGISVGWSWNPRPTGCRGNVIENNHIHHVMRILSDGGGIYTLGHQPGTVLRGNRIHDVPLNAGRAESNGIFMDEGSDQILVEANVIDRIEKSPIRFHRAEAITLRRNRLASRTGVPTFRYNNASADTMVFEQNEIVENAAGELPAK